MSRLPCLACYHQDLTWIRDSRGVGLGGPNVSRAHKDTRMNGRGCGLIANAYVQGPEFCAAPLRGRKWIDGWRWTRLIFSKSTSLSSSLFSCKAEKYSLKTIRWSRSLTFVSLVRVSFLAKRRLRLIVERQAVTGSLPPPWGQRAENSHCCSTVGEKLSCCGCFLPQATTMSPFPTQKQTFYALLKASFLFYKRKDFKDEDELVGLTNAHLVQQNYLIPWFI